MRIAATSVRRPVGTCMIFFAVLVVGLVALRDLAVDLLPSAEVPWISITTRYEGVAPQEIETLITRPIEQAVSTVEGVEQITASSSESLSRVSLAFEWGTDLEAASNDIRAKLDLVRNRLPDEADAPIVYKFDLSSVPVADLGLSGTGDVTRLRYVADEILSRRLEAVPGVASVNVRGGRVREIRVELDPDRLAALGVRATDVSAALARENRNVSAGDMRDAGRETIIRATGEYASLREIEETVVTTRGERAIRVRDLGRVVDDVRELQSELWINGDPGIRLSVSKRSGANTVEVAEALRREIDAINAEYGGRLRIDVLFDASEFIKASVLNVENAARDGAILAVLILLLFLRNLRATFVIAIAIPISILATFALMFGADISLNIISLGGLALGVGMLVDNSIVILENVFRKLELGLPRARAAIEGTAEMAGAVLAGTLTTVAVFVPVIFLQGFTSVFFGEMALVVSFSLFCSLAVALTLVPALGAMLLRPVDEPPGWRGRLFRRAGAVVESTSAWYARLLDRAIARPGRTIGVSVAIFLVSLVGLPWVGTELMPQTDEGAIDFDFELPVGTPLETTMEVMREAERRVLAVLEDGELRNVTTVAGPEVFWRPGGSNEGEVELLLTPVSSGRRPIGEIMDAGRRALAGMPGVDVRMRPRSTNPLMRMMRGGGDRLAVEIRGYDLEAGDALAARVIATVKEIPGVTDAFLDREPGKRELQIRPDRERLADVGLTGQDLADTVEHYVLGRVATWYRDAGAEYDVRVRLQESARERVQSLPHLPLVTPSGAVIPLGAVATVDRTVSPGSIARKDQERLVIVNVGLAGDRPLSEVAAEVDEAIAGIEVPEGFRLSLAGELEEQQEAFASLVVGILLAVFLVFAVLVVQLESLKQPLVIMTAVPFAAPGVLAALLLTGTTFNLNSFLGTIVLVGIVVNNAIVLVTSIDQIRADEGLGVREAVREAGLRRLRPVLMTTATTVLGMLPLAFGLAEGSEIQVPLARVIVGGLTLSTLVTLVFVPALYLAIEGRREKAAAPAAEAAAA